MYPRVSDLLRDLLGLELPFPIYSFGLMVAVAILVGAALMKREMDRMHTAGQLPGVRLKVRDGKGRDRFETTSPSALVWTLMLIAAAAGIAGSKLFYFFEQWPTFVRDPLGVAFSPAGLTFYGGLICGSAAIASLRRSPNHCRAPAVKSPATLAKGMLELIWTWAAERRELA